MAGGLHIDDPVNGGSPPGSWRAALAPAASCKACGQALCDHPDAIYAGIVPLGDGGHRDNPGASAAAAPFHSTVDSAQGQRDHG